MFVGKAARLFIDFCDFPEIPVSHPLSHFSYIHPDQSYTYHIFLSGISHMADTLLSRPLPHP